MTHAVCEAVATQPDFTQTLCIVSSVNHYFQSSRYKTLINCALHSIYKCNYAFHCFVYLSVLLILFRQVIIYI